VARSGLLTPEENIPPHKKINHLGVARGGYLPRRKISPSPLTLHESNNHFML